jgi:cytochrome c oxidase assembly protein subunit 15
MRNNLVIRLTFISSILALCVVILGVYTRLTDAGLGCPDWPTCYNHLTVPKNIYAVQQAQISYPSFPLNQIKAWTEMIHRYAASFLALLILALTMMMISKRKVTNQTLWLPFLLIGLIIFQALLGMWTVTLRLNPVAVMSHLLGGFSILALLWWYFLNSFIMPATPAPTESWRKTGAQAILKPLRYLAMIGLIILTLQISLGGWTSANNAALACPDFPTCINHQFLPQTNFKDAFNLWNSAIIAKDYAALVTIHMMHRIGALITCVYLLFFAFCLLRIKAGFVVRKLAILLMIALFVQISLGIMNVVYYLPLSVAVLHNVMAVVLLLSMITINFYLFKQSKI